MIQSVLHRPTQLKMCPGFLLLLDAFLNESEKNSDPGRQCVLSSLAPGAVWAGLCPVRWACLLPLLSRRVRRLVSRTSSPLTARTAGWEGPLQPSPVTRLASSSFIPILQMFIYVTRIHHDFVKHQALC